ncbi:uncharacterized protein BO97DRAFT_343147, partial [Aspergillus homomorphus CBS 101889]
IAPAPTPVAIGCCRNGLAGREERSRLAPLERCLKNHILLGEPGSQTADLEIIDPIKVGDCHNSQVFVAEVQERDAVENKKRTVVVKVYDPLYFDDDEGYLNPFLCMDRHYTHEVHAYTSFSHLQGSLIPEFYGSFSLEIPVSESTVRIVRLIVMEYIPGIFMQQAIPEDFALPCRQQIIKSVIEFESRQAYQHNIILYELTPRNVMLLDPARYPQRKIVFLDFDGAHFGRRFGTTKPTLSWSQYISPLLRWDLDMAYDFRNWIDWDFEAWIKSEYASDAHSITQEMRDHYTIN